MPSSRPAICCSRQGTLWAQPFDPGRLLTAIEAQVG